MFLYDRFLITVLHENDILIVKDGATTGKTSFISNKFPYKQASINEHVFRLVINQKMADPKYIFHYLNSSKGNYDILLNFRGATVGGITKDFINHIQIPLPPLETQKQIAAVLDKADELRQKRKQANAKLDEFLQSVFLDMFGDPVRNPKGWVFKKIDEVSEIVSGITLGQKNQNKETKEVPYLRVANVQDGFLDLSEIKYIDCTLTEFEKIRLEPGDVLMTEGGDFDKLGRGAIWNGQIKDCIHQNHLFRVRVDKQKLLPNFFAYLIRSRYSKLYFLKCSKKTSNLATINMTQLKQFPVPLPPLDLQNKFAQIVEKVEDQKAKNQTSAQKLDDLFNCLLQRAFKGELGFSCIGEKVCL